MLIVKDVSLSLRQTTLLHNVSFEVQPGEILTLMGPSGSGKSSLFAWMIGALPGDFRATGELWINARRCDALPTEQRKLGLLFQDALLFDHFSVGQNLLLALPAAVKGEARKQQVNDALDAADLSGFFHRDPATLSGGQRARVSLLRALLAQPQALLLDEPFSRLDKNLRDQFRRWVFAEVRTRQIPVVQVTHDEDDISADGQVLPMAGWQ
ncbi:ATP-binding cassette domain-containing protein [Leclercia sp.]|uniref:ATP-binding cassette domain-containing protein n=1 Tax=Leclercia sp. TaxID=1898428 RepID=UPI002FDEC460